MRPLRTDDPLMRKSTGGPVLTVAASDGFLDELTERVLSRILPLVQTSRTSPYMNVSEAADHLRCKPQRIYDLRSSGRLSRASDGSRALVLRSEIEALVEQRSGVTR